MADVFSAEQGHEALSASITQTNQLIVFNAEHGNESTGPAFSHNLTVQSAEQGHTSSTLIFGSQLVVQSAEQGHDTLSAAITQLHNLATKSAEQGNTAENIVLNQSHILSLFSASTGHQTGVPTVTQSQSLGNPASAEQGFTAETPTQFLTGSRNPTVARTFQVEFSPRTIRPIAETRTITVRKRGLQYDGLHRNQHHTIA